MKRVVIEVSTDASVTINAENFSGPNCEKATAFLEKALGVVTKRVKKPEYTNLTKRTTTVTAGTG